MRMQMKPFKSFSRTWIMVVLLACGGVGSLQADDATGSGLMVSEVAGSVMLRGSTTARLTKLKAGQAFPTGDHVLVSGPNSRVELMPAAGGRWRIGSVALWMPLPDGGRLLSGTVLVEVPKETVWAVDSATGRALLGEGLWMVQAVQNDGLKLICIDGPAEVVAGGGLEPAGEKPARRQLRPGDVIFLQPGGLEFGPVVTVFLRELLVTSRLVNGFEHPLPQARRLQTLAYIQGERLKGVTNIFVGGAKDEKGFQLVVPATGRPRSESAGKAPADSGRGQE